MILHYMHYDDVMINTIITIYYYLLLTYLTIEHEVLTILSACICVAPFVM